MAQLENSNIEKKDKESADGIGQLIPIINAYIAIQKEKMKSEAIRDSEYFELEKKTPGS